MCYYLFVHATEIRMNTVDQHLNINIQTVHINRYEVALFKLNPENLNEELKDNTETI